MTWVPWIEVGDENSSDEKVRQLFNKTRNRITQTVSDTVRLTSLTPEVSELIHRLSAAIQQHATGLSVREKEVAALVVSVYNGCVH